MFFQMVNIAMNNAFILYNESNVERHRLYKKKAPYLHEVAYRMCRPWAIQKYRNTDNRHCENKVMLNMAFKLTDLERGDQLRIQVPGQAPRPAVAPAVAPGYSIDLAQFNLAKEKMGNLTPPQL